MGTFSDMDFFGYCCDLFGNTVASWKVIQMSDVLYVLSFWIVAICITILWYQIWR